MVRYDSGDTSGSESGDERATSTASETTNNYPVGSWRAWKEKGKQAYLKGDYASALQNYSQALQRQNTIHLLNNETNNNNSSLLPSTLDKQILLSNMVACRLKIGGAPQAEAAVANANKCISMNPKWSKGHMRLAEAHLALSKSTAHQEKKVQSSQRACEALQSVLQLDPTNPTAQNLLTKELRYTVLHNNNEGVSNTGERDHSTTTTSSSRPRQAPEPSAPPEHMDETHEQQQQQPPQTDGIDIEDDTNYVFAPSWQDRLSFWVQRVRTWYTGLSDDDKSLVKLAVLFVVLYVAFGGRFGLEYFGKSNSSSRRSSSVYKDFHRERLQRRRHEIIHNPDYSASDWDSTSYGSSRSSYGNNYHNRDYSTSSYGNSWGSWGRSGSGLSNGSYMLLVVVLSYIGQRFFGVGPYQVLFWVNMLAGRRNRWFAPRRGFGGWGQGVYFNPRAAHYRHRPGGMWR